MDWDAAFEPVVRHAQKQGRVLEDRPQQRALGQAVLDSIGGKRHLLGEARTGVGKSYGYLVPAIHAVRQDKRTVVSTETIALMDQLTDKDLPFLHSVYGGFGYRSLKGRSWYLCKNRARGWRASFPELIAALETEPPSRLRDGERRDVERVLGRKVPDDEWEALRGDSTFCAENKCEADRCWSTRARELALSANIVVTNHAMLRTDADMRMLYGDEVSLLGEVDVLVVDEAHTLERVLIDGWTETLSPYELTQDEAAVADGLEKAFLGGQFYGDVDNAFRGIERALAAVQRFQTLRQPDLLDNWRRANFPVREHTLYGGDAELLQAMTDYEVAAPKFLTGAAETLERVAKRLHVEAESVPRGARKIRKGANAARKVADAVRILAEAIPTRDSVVFKFGAPHAVIAYGREWYAKRERRLHRELEVHCVPLDVSERVKRYLLNGRTCIMVSATLSDPTDGSFDYVATSLGMEDARLLQVDSPFDFAGKQLVYVTPAQQPTESVRGARFSVHELLDLVQTANGRTLALFTARDELEHAAALIRGEVARGNFEWPLLVQEPGVNKQDLVEDFKRQEHSVLLATKSFFTGVDFPGETCSLVALCKFPLPQYNSLCRAQIDWWKKRGFPRWYERESLLVFAQAAGRLIRNETDRGVVALLDQRAADPREKVHATAKIGIAALGSRVTRDIKEVEKFLA